MFTRFNNSCWYLFSEGIMLVAYLKHLDKKQCKYIRNAIYTDWGYLRWFLGPRGPLRVPSVSTRPRVSSYATKILSSSVRSFSPHSKHGGHIHVAILAQFDLVLCDPPRIIYIAKLGKGSKKKTVKKRSGWPLGLTPPSPPPKRSGKCENFSTSCHIWGYFVVL